MGGRSSGGITYEEDDCPSPYPSWWARTSGDASCSPMRFVGSISLVGGGFHSVRRRVQPTQDMRAYAGVVIVADALEMGARPVAFHLRVDSGSTSW